MCSTRCIGLMRKIGELPIHGALLWYSFNRWHRVFLLLVEIVSCEVIILQEIFIYHTICYKRHRLHAYPCPLSGNDATKKGYNSTFTKKNQIFFKIIFHELIHSYPYNNLSVIYLHSQETHCNIVECCIIAVSNDQFLLQ